MTRSRNIMRLLDAEPFRPFRIRMVSGQTYEIRHPEMLMIGKSTARVYLPDVIPDSDDDTPTIWREVSLTLIESLESSDSPSSAKSN